MPPLSAVNVGFALVSEDKAAMLPEGLVPQYHLKVRGSLLASELDVPSSVTAVPATTLWAEPALATGAELVLDATTVTGTGALSTLPSFTTRAMV